jgi:hypothetical protein
MMDSQYSPAAGVCSKCQSHWLLGMVYAGGGDHACDLQSLFELPSAAADC